MMKEQIKWGCIQPLTGGMYIGAREAIGHDAEWILSYSGLNAVKQNGSCGNEYHLEQWFEKHEINVPRYEFQHKMFENKPIQDVIVTQTENCTDSFITKLLQPIDIVVAVPVCSGLSQATIGTEDTKKERNCNMEFITNYTLGVIQPKIYIFENAPGLVGAKGLHVRETLEEMAMQHGYSVAYYKTDTQYHYNCQKRPRTFVVFMKWNGDEVQMPYELLKQHENISIEEYFNLIPEDATQNDVTVKMSPINEALLNYFIDKYGDNWRETIGIHYFSYLLREHLTDDFLQYVNQLTFLSNLDKDKIEHYINHVLFKTEQGLNYYSTTIWGYENVTPSVMFKTIQSALHHKENRLWTIRECLHLMGMPDDFELQGDINSTASQIGQNVPVKTAQWITSEAVRLIENWNDLPERERGFNVKFFDNTKLN